MQFCHEIVEHHDQFKIELCDERNLFFPKIHHDVPQDLRFDGQSTVEAACLMSTEGDQCQMISYDQISSEQQNPAHFDENIYNNQGDQPLKKQKTEVKPNLRTLTQIFNEEAQHAIRHGCELITYDAAIQMKIETNGSLCSGNLEDIFCTHQNILTRTTYAQFTLSQDHQFS